MLCIHGKHRRLCGRCDRAQLELILGPGVLKTYFSAKDLPRSQVVYVTDLLDQIPGTD